MLPDHNSSSGQLTEPPFGTIEAGVRAKNCMCSDAAGAGGEAALGITAKSVRHSGRAARFRHQRHAARLLKGKGRVGLCRWSMISRSAGVDAVKSIYENGATGAHYEGVQTCGSVWVCPCCSARISETRREEMNKLLAWAREQGYRPMMVTLTARHGRDDDLDDLLNRMKDAKQRLGRHRRYTGLKSQIKGSVTATEVTGGGKNGWHPHFHIIVILSGDADLEQLREPWLASLRGAGLDGAGAAFQVQGAEAAGDYIAKWGAAEELTLSNQKKSRSGSGMTPAQLLAASCDDGDVRAGRLWVEYAKVFHGRRQLVWSRGLKALAGIDQVDDEQAAQDQKQEGQTEVGRANISGDLWSKGVAVRDADRRADLLDRVEEVGPAQAVAELAAGMDELIDEGDWRPRPGGIAERLAGSIVEPVQPSSGPKARAAAAGAIAHSSKKQMPRDAEHPAEQTAVRRAVEGPAGPRGAAPRSGPAEAPSEMPPGEGRTQT